MVLLFSVDNCIKVCRSFQCRGSPSLTLLTAAAKEPYHYHHNCNVHNGNNNHNIQKLKQTTTKTLTVHSSTTDKTLHIHFPHTLKNCPRGPIRDGLIAQNYDKHIPNKCLSKSTQMSPKSTKKLIEEILKKGGTAHAHSRARLVF